MFALRRATALANSPQVRQIVTRNLLGGPTNGAAPTHSFSTLALYPPPLSSSPPPSVSSALAAITTHAIRPWWQSLVDSLQEGIFQMSSTLKKRRSKMNKHKLQKRRKKNRMKNKK
jgi:hypothetical protein